MTQIIIVEKSITIHATTAKIYKALITATELTRWRADRAESDARMGGAVLTVRGDHEAHGVYKRLVPNREVAIHWDRHDHILPEDLTVFRLEKTAKGTKVLVDDFALPEEVDRVSADWDQQLKQLKKVYQAAAPKPKAKAKAKPVKKTTGKRKSAAQAKSTRRPVKAKRKK
jgi:uncharacterized protein YndB with AHSA1/START domain